MPMIAKAHSRVDFQVTCRGAHRRFHHWSYPRGPTSPAPGVDYNREFMSEVIREIAHTYEYRRHFFRETAGAGQRRLLLRALQRARPSRPRTGLRSAPAKPRFRSVGKLAGPWLAWVAAGLDRPCRSIGNAVVASEGGPAPDDFIPNIGNSSMLRFRSRRGQTAIGPILFCRPPGDGTGVNSGLVSRAATAKRNARRPWATKPIGPRHLEPSVGKRRWRWKEFGGSRPERKKSGWWDGRWHGRMACGPGSPNFNGQGPTDARWPPGRIAETFNLHARL